MYHNWFEIPGSKGYEGVAPQEFTVAVYISGIIQGIPRQDILDSLDLTYSIHLTHVTLILIIIIIIVIVIIIIVIVIVIVIIIIILIIIVMVCVDARWESGQTSETLAILLVVGIMTNT